MFFDVGESMGICKFTIQLAAALIGVFASVSNANAVIRNQVNHDQVQSCILGQIAGGCTAGDYKQIQIVPPNGTGSFTGLYRQNMSQCSVDPDATSSDPACVIRIRGFARVMCPGGVSPCQRASGIGLGCTVDPLPAHMTSPGASYLAQSLCNQQNLLMITPKELLDTQDKFAGGLPSCADGENLVFVNGTWKCQVPAPKPSCGPNELLTVNDGVWGCIAALPTCTSGQFLNYNGTTWNCITPAFSPTPEQSTCNASVCTDSENYCAGVAYYNLANQCTCAGTKACGGVPPGGNPTSVPNPKASPTVEPELRSCPTVSFCHLNKVFTAVCKNHTTMNLTPTGAVCTDETRAEALQACAAAPANCLLD